MNSGPCNHKMPYAPYHPLPLTSDAPEFELCINSDVRACTVMCALNVISIVIGKTFKLLFLHCHKHCKLKLTIDINSR